MINAGFNPLQQISEKTGKSISQLKEEMSKGAISAQMVQQAFIDATSAGGKFYNMSENASKTINGQISMMQDAMDAVFNEIGTKTEGVIIKGIQMTTSLIQNYENIGKVLVGLVATYGTYKTAVLMASVATGKLSIAEMALTKIRLAGAKAQKALNAAMLTNPYVALATVVAGLAATMWVLRDSTTAAERAQKEYGLEKEAEMNKEREHAQAIQSLIDKANDETQATMDREAALLALKEEYPNIFAQYDLEKLKLEDILKIKKQINEADAQKRQLSREERLEELDTQIEKAESDVAYYMQAGAVGPMKEAAKQRDVLKEKRELLVKEILQDSIANFTSSLSDTSLETLQQYQKKLESGEFELDGKKIDKATSDTLKKAVEAAINKSLTATTYYEDYEKAKKEWENAKKELDKIEKDKKAYTAKQYEEAKNRVETAEKNFKKLGGDTTGKKANKDIEDSNAKLTAQDKVDSLDRKNATERARAAKDMEFMVEQARIDAMQEGEMKRWAQRQLDNKKELENLERQKQDYINKVVEQEKAAFDAKEELEAKNNDKYKKKSFDEEKVRASVDTSAYDKAISLTTQRQMQGQDESLKHLLDNYKSYEDKKQEILLSYLEDSDLLQAMYEETGDERYKRSLDERHKAYVKATENLEKEYGTTDYKLIFGDPSKMTSKTIETALDKARKKMSQLDKDADPETFKALVDAIDRLEDARDSNPFQGWDTSVMGLIQKLNQVRNIRKDIAKYEEQGNVEAKEASEAELEKAKKNLSKALVGTGVSKFGDALSEAAASMKQVAEASGDIDLMKQAEALEDAAGFISSVAAGAASGGWIGAIVGGATSLMDMLVSSITESKAVAAEAKKTFNEYLDEVAHKARSINNEDYETIFGVRTLEKVIDASGKAQKALGDLGTAMNAEGTTYSVSVFNKTLTRTQNGLANMLVLAGEKNPNKNIKTLENIPTLAEKFDGLFDDKGNLNLQKAKEVLDAYSKYSNEEWYEALSDATSALQDYEENMKIVDNYLSSLFSDLGSDLADAIMQGNDALEVLEKSAGNIFSSIAKQIIVETMLSQEFIDNYKKKMREAMATEGSEDDARVLTEMVDDLGARIGDAKDKWEEIRKIAEEKGIDLSGTDAESQQSASRRGYETLSEDTGNELVGRALAQYESNLRMESAMHETREVAEMMSVAQSQIRDIAAESRALIADSFLELQLIRENTGNSAKLLKAIDARMLDWDSKIKSL